MIRGVVVTGVGTAGVFGWGAPRLAEALASSAPPAGSEIDLSAGFHRSAGSRRALLTPLSGIAGWLAPGEARRMSPPSRLATAASRMALQSAGLQQVGEATSVAMATAFGATSFSEALLRQILLDAPEAASPYCFTESVANAAAAQVAILCGARGPNLTVCQREASALLAVGRGAAEVASGRVERCLAGVVDEVTPLLHAVLDRFRALARPSPCRERPGRSAGAVGAPGEGEEIARPFDLRRTGFCLADGATVLVLEREEVAAARGATAHARVRGWGGAFDASAPPTGWGEGSSLLGRALRRFLARCGAAPSDVERIVSGASGSRAGDRLEALTLRAAWEGQTLPPVVAPKAAVGEFGGGFLGAAVLAAGGARFGATPGFAEPDPRLGLTPHDGRPLAAPALVLATSLAAGGAAGWLLLEAPGPSAH